MDCLNNNYLNIPDLDGIINQYLIGETKMQNSNLFTNLNAYITNMNANRHGADVFITEPMLDQLCREGHYLLVIKYIDYCISIDTKIINISFKLACYNGHFEIV